MTDVYGDSRVSRREALGRLSATAAAAAATGGVAALLLDRRDAEAALPLVPDWRIGPGSAANRAVSAHGDSPARNVRRTLGALGGMDRFVRKGETVLIKPNAGWDRLPEQAANTDPEVVATLVTLCREAGAGRVIVADLSVNDGVRCFTRSGLRVAAEAAGAEVFDVSRIKTVAASLPGTAEGQEVMDLLFGVQRVINVPVAKHHGLSRVTVGMKNWFGVLGRGRGRLHQGIDRNVAELGAIFRPTLTVVDATRVLLSGGPQGGSLAGVKAVNAVAAGTDPVLCDAWGALQLGVDPRSLGFLREAEQRGLGSTDVKLVREVSG